LDALHGRYKVKIPNNLDPFGDKRSSVNKIQSKIVKGTHDYLMVYDEAHK
jgi:hypothetical protein